MIKWMVLFIGIACSLPLQAQEFKTAVEYNDYIVGQQDVVGTAILNLNMAMSEETIYRESIQPYYDDLLAASKIGLANISKMPAYEGNIELRNAAIELFVFYEQTFNNEYKQLLDLVFKEDLDDESLNQIDILLEKITNDEKPIDEKFAKVQAAFAKKHGFDLTQNEMQEEIDAE